MVWICIRKIESLTWKCSPGLPIHGSISNWLEPSHTEQSIEWVDDPPPFPVLFINFWKSENGWHELPSLLVLLFHLWKSKLWLAGTKSQGILSHQFPCSFMKNLSSDWLEQSHKKSFPISFPVHLWKSKLGLVGTKSQGILSHQFPLFIYENLSSNWLEQSPLWPCEAVRNRWRNMDYLIH